MSTYGNSTILYQLRTPALGDFIDPNEELRTKQIIDNQLFGAIRVHSGGHGLIRLGTLQLVNPGDGTYSVYSVESKSTGKPSIEAFINQIYVYQDTFISWLGLLNNSVNYLYVQLVEGGPTQSSLQNKQVITSSNTTGVVPSNGILVAVLILNEPGNSVFVLKPTGIATIPVLGDHMVNNQNPHTPFLNQDDITVSGLTVLDTLNYRQLQVDQLIISGNSIISGNISCLGQVILSGNINVAGNVTYNYLQTTNLTVPGTLWASQLAIDSGLDVYGTAIFRQGIILNSGVTLNGFDPFLALPLINGANVDDLHNHVLGSLAYGVKPLYFSPEYPNTVFSGVPFITTISGTCVSVRNFNNNYYQYYSTATSGIPATAITQILLPQDFSSIDRLEVFTGVGSTLSGSNVTTLIYDKDFNQCNLTQNNGVAQNTTISKSIYNVSGGQFAPQLPITVMNSLYGASGVATYLGDMTLWYVPINGEKLILDWNRSGVGINPEKYLDGQRYVPADMRIQKIVFSQTMALSGSSVVGINTGSNNQIPNTIFQNTPKPTLNFGPTGSSFVSTVVVPTENTILSGGTLVTCDLDLVASGSVNASIQLIGYRI